MATSENEQVLYARLRRTPRDWKAQVKGAFTLETRDSSPTNARQPGVFSLRPSALSEDS